MLSCTHSQPSTHATFDTSCWYVNVSLYDHLAEPTFQSGTCCYALVLLDAKTCTSMYCYTSLPSLLFFPLYCIASHSSSPPHPPLPILPPCFSPPHMLLPKQTSSSCRTQTWGRSFTPSTRRSALPWLQSIPHMVPLPGSRT